MHRTVKRAAALTGTVLLALALATSEARGQADMPTTYTIFVSGMEVKGATTADKLAPPAVNPPDLSKGYGFKAPGQADKQNPQRWEVSSYMFSPSFVVVRLGDSVKLTAFIVNGDEHEVWVSDPEGRKIVASQKWHRGRQYEVSFVAEKTGSYHLVCSTHAPTMSVTFLVLPRR